MRCGRYTRGGAHHPVSGVMSAPGDVSQQSICGCSNETQRRCTTASAVNTAAHKECHRLLSHGDHSTCTTGRQRRCVRSCSTEQPRASACNSTFARRSSVSSHQFRCISSVAALAAGAGVAVRDHRRCTFGGIQFCYDARWGAVRNRWVVRGYYRACRHTHHQRFDGLLPGFTAWL
eukprot:COSAG01_NODE_12046_length_1808_cov_4.321240_2_plen_176_part_00